MPIQSCFPTPIYVDKLQTQGLKSFNREILDQCYLVKETDEDGQAWSRTHYIGGYTSYASQADLHLRYPHFEELAAKINPHVKRFSRHLDMDLQGGSLRMVSCWINIMPNRTAHSLHLHPLSVISGTFYVSVPKGSSQLKFEDPRLSKFMAAPPKRENARPRNLPFIKLEPKSGDLALWESWLRHEVPPNSSDSDRVSISFNYDWI